MEHLRKLINYFKTKDVPGIPRASEELFSHIEDVFLPHLLRVLKKDATLMAEVELFPGVKVPWEGTDEEWSLLNMALLYSVLHGDPQEKFGKIFESIKGLIPGGETGTNEISRILEDEETKSSIQEMLDLVMNTRLASLVGEIAQAVKYDDLDLDFENTEKMLEMIRNPQESPVLQELAERAKRVMEDKVRTGKLNQQELIREIETIRAKFQSSFGRYLNEVIVGDAGGGTTGNTSHQILSNSPDARRARMLARLQKKQKEKTRT
jgi:hypothetical protein